MLAACSVVSVTFFCLFSLPYQSDMQKCLPDNIRRLVQIQQISFFFPARDSRGVLSNANIEIVFHSRLAEMVKDVDKAQFLLLIALFQVAIQLLK